MARTETLLEPTTIRETLRVYDIHETGHNETIAIHTTRNLNSTELPITLSNPNNWPSDWRRIPPYRASSRTHRVSDRAAGQNSMEAAIVIAMFSGVWMVGAANRVWRMTAGRWNDRIMRYEVGGEW
ncbi:hypothetical protein F5884DRAFT_115620 [Xylogone sp. PMI_703]|nr:hypothetical protein F5884DRAFT_115620 [Xylogone sp. PMI_703]